MNETTSNGDGNTPLEDLWPNCHPSNRPNRLGTVARMQHVAPDFDIGTLVVPSGSLNASTIKALHYPINRCEERLRRFGEVKDWKNPSILSCIQKPGDDQDVLYIDMVPIRLGRVDVGELGLTDAELDRAFRQPYKALVNNQKILDILAAFWQWVMLSNTAKVVDIYGETVNEAFNALLSRFERFEAITLFEVRMFRGTDHCLAIYQG